MSDRIRRCRLRLPAEDSRKCAAHGACQDDSNSEGRGLHSAPPGKTTAAAESVPPDCGGFALSSGFLSSGFFILGFFLPAFFPVGTVALGVFFCVFFSDFFFYFWM